MKTFRNTDSQMLELAGFSKAINAMAAEKVVYPIPITPLEGERYELNFYQDPPMPGKAAKSNKKKEKNMCYECELDGVIPTAEDRRIAYLIDRLYSASELKRSQLRRQFGLIDDEDPKSFSDALARLNAGKYVIADDKKDKFTYSPLGYVRWRDPELKADEKGFIAADTKLNELRKTAEDTIRILPQTDGLKALQEFESATIN